MLKEVIIKEIENNSSQDMFVGDVLLYELNNLENVKLNPEKCSLFRTGRHKNDLPSVCKFGVADEAMTDCLGAVKESGDGKDNAVGNVIVSDHLTVLGKDDNALVIAFYGGEHHLVRTEIYVDNSGNFNGLKVFAEFNCLLKPEEKRVTERLDVFTTNDVTSSIKKWALERVGNISVHTKKCPAVFCTWYYYERTVTYEDVCVNLNKIKERNVPFDVFQIDDGWEVTPGEWKPNENFPEMKSVAQKIKSFGLTAGIWTSPFVAHRTACVFKEHPDWILRDENGLPCVYNVNGEDFYIFDISIEETWDYFEELYRHLTFDWGFTYHKLDFTRAPIIAKSAAFANKNKTVIECYRNAVCAIRRGMGNEAFFLMCGGLYDPLIGLVDAQRTGSDVLSMWSSSINKNGKTLPYTVKQSLLRYYMNNWWYNDPDALVIRKNEIMERGTRLTYGLLNDDEVRTSTLNQLIGGGLVCSTEPLDKIDDDRLSNLKHILPVRAVETEPVKLMDIERYPDKIRLREKSDKESSYLVLINWNDNDAVCPVVSVEEIAGKNLKIEKGKEYFVCDFYARKIYKNLNENSKIILSEIPAHASTILKLTQNNPERKNVDFEGHYLM